MSFRTSPDGAWSLVRGNNRLTIAFYTDQIEKCLLDWNQGYGSICLESFAKTQWLEPGETTTVRQSWTISGNR